MTHTPASPREGSESVRGLVERLRVDVDGCSWRRANPCHSDPSVPVAAYCYSCATHAAASALIRLERERDDFHDALGASFRVQDEIRNRAEKAEAEAAAPRVRVEEAERRFAYPVELLRDVLAAYDDGHKLSASIEREVRALLQTPAPEAQP